MIFTPLLSHQRKALAYLKSHNLCALFLPLGAGKSLVALAYADWLNARRILICSDKNNIINTWNEEVWRHTDFKYVLRPNDPTSISFNKPTCVGINYDLLTHRWEKYKEVGWDLVILDESGEIKDQRTDRHRTLNRVVRDIPHKIILNGTPATERLEDLFGQFKILDGGASLGTSLTRFRLRYMNYNDITGYGWLPQRSAYTRIQRDCRNVSYWLTKTKVRMPERHYHKVEVDMTEEQKQVDEELKQWFAAEFDREKIEVSHAAALFIKRVQLMGGVFRADEASKLVPTNKLSVLTEIIASNPQAKIVIWHSYIPETALLVERLSFCKNLSIMDDPRKQDVLSKFHKVRSGVLLIRTSLCKGINQLADTDIAIFYSNPFSYARRAQAEGRSRRITSKTSITHYVDIITKGGADEMVYQLLSNKKSFSLTLPALRAIMEYKLR